MRPAKEGLDLGLVVRDLATMTGFYRDVVGLPVLGERENGWGTMVELGFGESVLRLVRPHQEPTAAEPAELLGRSGVRYLTFPVADLDDVAGRIVAAGAPTVLETVAVGAVRFVMYADPEGNVVELLERAVAPEEVG